MKIWNLSRFSKFIQAKNSETKAPEFFACIFCSRNVLAVGDGSEGNFQTGVVCESCFFISDAYTVEQLENGDTRTVLKLDYDLAPVKYAVFPLLKNKPELVEKAREVYAQLSKKFVCEWDDNGNIGKRYRRQDEIGTPYCVVIDFDTLEDGTVTVRSRDTTEQTRIKFDEL